MFWAVLALFVVAYPLTPRLDGTLWYAHIATVALLSAACAGRLWRTPKVVAGVPFVVVALALASLAVAVTTSQDRFPRTEVLWASLTGASHAVLFLLALLMTRPADGRDESGLKTLQALSVVLIALLLVQGTAVLLQDRSGPESWRASGTLGNPNALAAVMAAGTLALAAFARWRPSAVLLLVPFAVLVVATRSRGVVAATGLVLLVFLARLGARRALAVAVAGTLALVLIPNPLRERIHRIQPEHVFPRSTLWALAVQNIAAEPAGIGPAMNKYVFPAVARMEDRPWLIHQRHEVGLTHNVLLTLTLEWGWLAGAAVLVLCVWTTRKLWVRGPPDRLGQGAILGASVMFLELQVDGIEQNPMVFSVFLVLLAVGIRRTPPEPRGLAVPGRVAAVALALFAFVLVAEGTRRAWGASALAGAREMVEVFDAGEGDEAAVRAALQQAEARVPGDARAPLLRFEFEFARCREQVGADGEVRQPEVFAARMAEAQAAIERAQRANPADPHLPRRAAWLTLHDRRTAPQSTQAFSTYFGAMNRVLRLDPLDVEARWDLAFEAHRAGRFALRDRQLDALFRLEPDFARAWVVMAYTFEVEGQRERALYAFVRAEEAVLNCRILTAVASPRSRAFYQDNLDRVDLTAIRGKIAQLRRELYF